MSLQAAKIDAAQIAAATGFPDLRHPDIAAARPAEHALSSEAQMASQIDSQSAASATWTVGPGLAAGVACASVPPGRARLSSIAARLTAAGFQGSVISTPPPWTREVTATVGVFGSPVVCTRAASGW